ncbi:hypothetical protein J1N35_009796 [Gossypium stocksii]|uniref:MADS-box domain-containing protein n=1 Tax=Gossypium stocksii TaxID=47602 RepID=A0A9D3W0U6_9ROSI|nr:hypothetical protein J1N35_009796 [Gossypium stocksii]
MKKVSELSTFCGIGTCAIMYNPYKSRPEVWPSPRGVQQVLSKFNNIPKMEQSASSLLSSSVAALAPMMMVTPEAILRTSMEEIGQTEMDNMELINNNNPQTHVRGDKMTL